MIESPHNFKISEDLARKMTRSAKTRLDEIMFDYYEDGNPSKYLEEEFKERTSELQESLDGYYLTFPHLKDELGIKSEQLSSELFMKDLDIARGRIKELNKKFSSIDSTNMTEQEEDREQRIIGNEIEQLLEKYPALKIEEEAGYLD